MRKLNKKQASLLNTGRQLFWKYGFKRVTIEEICREANTSKMTFYKYFPNKLELAKAVFDSVVDESLAHFQKILHADLPPSDKMKQLLMAKMEGTHDISKEFLADFYGDAELGLKDHIEQKTQETWSTMRKDFERAQENGLFRKDLNLDFYIYVSQKMIEIINDPYLNSLYSSADQLIMEFTNLLLYGVSPHKYPLCVA
ncbi:TetR/AcrR family transcriptional regulator [Geofilum rubicundum]|uniref:Transcriptional regulator, TetR family n=1 Tax=Geofilum rubicundum JCM 15548 TaxID=1236989 RepID=A0A0E9LX37_9BACT|nr:TetR/AcrR family transcriptional regulator [Geofilum rubicundum]GAO30137.1 transcriptional regulator, TetR family [Geofilum rubicundum JCM 15548]